MTAEKKLEQLRAIIQSTMKPVTIPHVGPLLVISPYVPIFMTSIIDAPTDK